ncbi:Histidine kinase [Caprobacter fermentans]|uniref:histidine kinase n=1 Tax=Caproicibacter fermentans TaxID=2576756 RepID=A0A6N8HXA2_9FIRM|nr:sensor histidine kinase [Caproicibacter fermentans]MVB10299.1 Histidine kinase [Caproicibacter fermentans]
MRKAILRWYRNINFRQKVSLVCICAGLFPVLALGIFCYGQIQTLLINREKQAESETVEQAALVLQSRLDTYRNMISNIAWNDNIGQAVSRTYSNNFEMYLTYRDIVDPLFATVPLLNGDVLSETLYTSSNLNPHGDTVQTINEAKKMPWYSTAVHATKPTFYISRENQAAYLSCPIFSAYQKRKNYLSIKLDYNKVYSQLDTLFTHNFGVFLLDGNTVLYAYQDFGRKELMIPDGQIAARLKGDSLRQNYIGIRQELPSEGWSLYLIRPLNTVRNNTWPILLTVLLVVIGCTVMLHLLTHFLSFVIVRPLESLTRNMQSIERNGLFIDLPPSEFGQDEIGVLSRQFHTMVEKLQQLVNEVYKARTEKQEYEIKALQAQINPHFFYNSLSLINSKAILAGQDEISEMAQLLSAFYRTTLNRGNPEISVEDEWENTVSYIKIQEMMHSHSFQFEEKFDPSVSGYKMPNLILQPLVENSIVHGIDHRVVPGRGQLKISAELEDGKIRFVVEDNGCGISPAKLQNILTTESSGYGLQNIQRRIQLYFGKEFGLSFTSTVNEGTTVILRIPTRTALPNVDFFRQEFGNYQRITDP